MNQAGSGLVEADRGRVFPKRRVELKAFDRLYLDLGPSAGAGERLDAACGVIGGAGEYDAAGCASPQASDGPAPIKLSRDGKHLPKRQPPVSSHEPRVDVAAEAPILAR